MADTKISALPSSTTPLAGTEVLPIVQSSTTKKVTVADLTAGRTVDAETLNATNVEVTNVKAKDGTAAVSIADSTGVVTIDSSILTTTDINGGAIDGTVIGGATPAAGTFTTLDATTGNITTGNITTGNITTGVFADGSASAPSVTNTGDTNTGVYFPAADEVAVTAGGTVAAAFNSNGVFFRNRIINGDMRIDQRNAGAAVTTTNSYAVDRFLIQNVTDGAFSLQQDTSVPTGSGFVNSIKFTTTTADGSLASTQNITVQHRIEGTNVADLMWGSASARTVTLSFWVRSSLTGTFGGTLVNSALDRSYPFTYSISVADTWEYKTVTIPGDTTGTWLTTTGIGIRIYFGLGVGTDRSGTAGAWAGANYNSATGAVSVIGTLNATWYVTGVQLETGSVATPFERRPYGTEFFLCQRYYQTGTMRFRATLLSGTIEVTNQLVTTMRATPTMTGTGVSSLTANTILISDSSTGSTGNVAYTAASEL